RPLVMFWATTSASLRHATMLIKSAPRLPSSPTKGLSTASVKVATGVPFWVYRRFGSAVKRPMSITLFITQHLQKFGVVMVYSVVHPAQPCYIKGLIIIFMVGFCYV